MKKRTSLLMIMMFMTFGQLSLMAQCPTNGMLMLSKQQDIINFQKKYPKCTALPSGLLIQAMDYYAIKDLNGLSQISSIEGDLILANNDGLTNLKGLHNITKVGGSLYIETNDDLVNLKGLEALKSIKGNIKISTNNKLKTLSGLDNLKKLSNTSTITLFNNDSLENIDVLNNTQNLANIKIYDNDLLEDKNR